MEELSILGENPEVFLQYDDLYSLNIGADYLSEFGVLIAKSKKKAKSKTDLEKIFAQTLQEMTYKLIGNNRVTKLDVFLTRNEDQLESEDNVRKYVVALSLGEDWADPLFRGPQSNTPEGKEFRSQFGDLSEIRKYADNSLCETVEWVKMNKNAYPEENEDILKSIPQRWLEFIVYKKLMVPEGSLSSVIKKPRQWTSLIPKSQLPPSFVHSAFAKLGKMFREVKDLPLAIVGVNCVSGHYRNTEPLQYCAAPKIVGSASKSAMKKLSTDENASILPLQQVVEVYTSLERNGKWGKVPTQIEAYKTLYYDTLSKELTKQFKCLTVPQKDRIIIKIDGVVFSMRVVHDEELEKQRIENENPQKVPESFTKHAHLAITAQKLHSISQKFSAFGEGVQLAKRFVAGAKLSNHFDPLAIELMVAYAFLNTKGRDEGNVKAMTPFSGFLQFLKLIATHNFVEQPLIIDMNENFLEETKTELIEQFKKRRPVLPPIVLITPEDKSGVRLMAKKTEPFAAKRLVELARRKWTELVERLAEGKHCDLRVFFTTKASIYDLKIQISSKRRTFYQVQKQLQQSTRDKVTKKCVLMVPVLEFDVTKRLLAKFETNFGSKVMFFYDEFETDKIFAALRPNFKAENVQLTLTNCPLKKKNLFTNETEVNLKALAEDLMILGQGTEEKAKKSTKKDSKKTKKMKKEEVKDEEDENEQEGSADEGDNDDSDEVNEEDSDDNDRPDSGNDDAADSDGEEEESD
ncbi:unnamed protein product [Bursaphelenchus okinawaensis]|uniref:Nucleolar protein 6 n=1 Tax=Bursaphelenchus okinawaensis TaxID=465554 RepID=A0A811K1W7_9BILA|nr:unnamed protein product [Bursaphelenchus okinawaensis]CAG9090077.1 unnamed protein product [Bursaphelenchus okinawaensis]